MTATSFKKRAGKLSGPPDLLASRLVSKCRIPSGFTWIDGISDRRPLFTERILLVFSEMKTDEK